MPTLQQVAAEAHVSQSTASRVLNGSARQVGADMRQRVLHTAERLGYVPNGPAAATATGHTKLVGVLVTSVQDPLLAAFLAGVLQEAEATGVLVVVGEAGDVDRARRVLGALRAQRVPLIIVAGDTCDESGTVDLAEDLDVFARDGAVIRRVHAAGNEASAWRRRGREALHENEPRNGA